jgi:hypothetical protein
MTWGTSTNPAGTFAKEKDVPSQEVRKFCRQNNLAFVTENLGFYGTSIYARDIGAQMFCKLKFDVTVPLEDEWKAMIAAKDAFVKQQEAKAEADRIGRLIKEVRVSDDGLSIIVMQNSGRQFVQRLNFNGEYLYTVGIVNPAPAE